MFRIIILSFFISTFAIANDKNHTIGIEYSYADINNGTAQATSELNDLITSHYASSYQYKVMDYIAIGLGYLKGDSSHADGIFIDIFTDSKIDYHAISLSASLNYPISKTNYFYFKVNALQYDYDIIDDSKLVYTEDGNDLGYSVGWRYEFNNGIGFNTGYEVLNLGKHIDIKGFNIGVSYRF